MTNCVLQVFVQPEKKNKRFPIFEALYGYSQQCAMRYAEKHDAEYVQFTGPRLYKDRSIVFEKLCVFDSQFDAYDKVFYVDMDALITPACPNVFEHERFAAVGTVHPEKFLSQRSFKSGYRYFNSGVMMFDRRVRKVFSPELLDKYAKIYQNRDMKFHDQQFFNQLICHEYGNYDILDRKWNAKFEGYAGKQRTRDYVIHFMGVNDKGKFKKKQWEL
jgi:lipopolysaccharide biosynthesis glycosyltransferase